MRFAAYVQGLVRKWLIMTPAIGRLATLCIQVNLAPRVCGPDGLTQHKVVIKQGLVCRAFGKMSSLGRAGIVHPWNPQVTNPRDGGMQIGPWHVPSSLQAF